jgi:mRNA-degrading endonuclease RelE of RelBE toxin-antitoxin system
VTERRLLFDTGWMNGYREMYETDRLAAKRVRAAVSALARDPEPPGSLHLSGSSFHRLHIGDYRVLYDLDDDTVRVWSLGKAPR